MHQRETLFFIGASQAAGSKPQAGSLPVSEGRRSLASRPIGGRARTHSRLCSIASIAVRNNVAQYIRLVGKRMLANTLLYDHDLETLRHAPFYDAALFTCEEAFTLCYGCWRFLCIRSSLRSWTPRLTLCRHHVWIADLYNQACAM